MPKRSLCGPALACLLGTAAASAGAADPTPPLALGWLPSEVFDAGEGLPDTTVNDIAVLPDGEVWIATMRGLARMHGARMLAEPGGAGMADKAVLAVAATASGDLLASVEEGGVYRRHDQAWQALGTPFHDARTQRIRVFDDGGRERIFATGGGVAEWDGKRWRSLPLPAAANGHEVFDIALQAGKAGTPDILWVATFGGGLLRCPLGAACAPVAIEAPGPRTDEARSLLLQALPGQRSALWVGFHGGGVARLLDGAWTRWHAGNSGLPSDFVTDLERVSVPGAGEQIWAGTRSGLATLQAGGDWQLADPRVPQLRERVRTIAQGRHGSMPAHRELLGETRARLVAAYVWSLSHNGAQSTAQPAAK